MTISIELLATMVASIAAVLGLLWLTIRIVRHAWKGATVKAYTVEAALAKVRTALEELRKYYPGVADNFSNGLATGVLDAHGLDVALTLALEKLDSGDLSGAREQVERIKLWYDKVTDLIQAEREQATRS